MSQYQPVPQANMLDVYPLGNGTLARSRVGVFGLLKFTRPQQSPTYPHLEVVGGGPH